jgi:hypothetical protein
VENFCIIINHYPKWFRGSIPSIVPTELSINSKLNL